MWLKLFYIFLVFSAFCEAKPGRRRKSDRVIENLARNSQCGKTNLQFDSTGSTFSVVEEGGAPWHVLIVEALCDGTLVSAMHVITSATCVEWASSEFSKSFRVRLGALNVEDNDRNVQEFTITSRDYSVHSDFSGGYPDYHYTNNIALIKLPGIATLSDRVSPACLPPPRSDMGTLQGSDVFMSAFSRDDELAVARLSVNDKSSCQSAYWTEKDESRYNYPRKLFCANFKNSDDGCEFGDIGSPLFTDLPQVGGGAYLIGVENNKVGSCTGTNNLTVFYTKVANYVNWIYENDIF